MAYRDYNGKITIDEVAAKKDINRINEAILKMENAGNSINQLVQQGTQMKGQSAQALVSKGSELKKQIDKLINSLQAESSSISKAVAKYKRIDQEVKAAMERNS
jgi:uncharacterized protein YlxW (UPF0749 family)